MILLVRIPISILRKELLAMQIQERERNRHRRQGWNYQDQYSITVYENLTLRCLKMPRIAQREKSRSRNIIELHRPQMIHRHHHLWQYHPPKSHPPTTKK